MSGIKEVDTGATTAQGEALLFMAYVSGFTVAGTLFKLKGERDASS